MSDALSECLDLLSKCFGEWEHSGCEMSPKAVAEMRGILSGLGEDARELEARLDNRSRNNVLAFAVAENVVLFPRTPRAPQAGPGGAA